MTAALGLLVLIVVLLAGTVPSLFGYESFVVYSGSMEPAIGVGDLAVVGPTKPEQLMVGNVITYRTVDRPGVVVTHRLISIGKDEKGRLVFETRGDANASSDQVLVDQGAVLGRVVYTIPKLGYLVDFSKQPQGKVLLIGIPGLLLALDYMIGRGRRKGAVKSPKSAAGQLVLRGQAVMSNGGALSDAVGFFDQAIGLDPHLEDAWLLKAECAAGAERLACLRTALTVNPNSARLKKAVELAVEASGVS